MYANANTNSGLRSRLIFGIIREHVVRPLCMSISVAYIDI